ncbi:MAG: FAD-dependent oxidoreductase [Planctomycetota bacterium]|nr:FAD-dependent oxidoreductase [Planctomycetota bacterium]
MRVLAFVLVATIAASSVQAEHREFETDLLIAGGTESGWAAAIQAARQGVKSVTIVHDGEWLGGQFTEQALACVDENKGVGLVGWGVDWHPMKRSFHRSGLFKELMDRIEAFNTEKYGSPMPGRPYHGPSTFRPAEAQAIFRAMLQPYLDSGQVRFLTNRYPVRADVSVVDERPKLTGLWFAPLGEVDSSSAEPDLHIRARLTIDASDWGEAIQVSGAAYECGPDSQSRYGEPSAPPNLDNNPPNEMNPITWAMIIEESDSETPIAMPARFDDRYFVRTTQLSYDAMKELSWDRPVRLGSIPHWPDKGKASPRQLSVYTVRRIADGRTSKTRKTSILLNYMLGQDYPLERLPQDVEEKLEATEPGASQKNIVQMTRAQRQIVFDDAKRQSLSVLFHMQNFVHERAPDKTNSFRRFHLSDEFGTADRLPPKPYIRESLRLKAMYMMREQDGRNADGFTKDKAKERFARVLYPDGLFCWQFHYDFHRTGRAYLIDSGDGRSWGNRGPWTDFEKPGRNTRYVSDRSVFPLRSLVPVEMDGLLGAQKNVGYSSIVCAAIRLHDQCIAIGQAAGATAAVALRHDVAPRSLPYDRTKLEEIRGGLCRAGEPVALQLWPYRDLPADHPAFVAINRLGARRAFPHEPLSVDFHPDALAESAWREAVVQHSLSAKLVNEPLPVPTGEITRGEFCRVWWKNIEQLPDTPWLRRSEDDADGDGILDRNDPTLFSAAPDVVWQVEPGPAIVLTPKTDGLPGVLPKNANRARQFNFTGPESKPVPGFTNDSGEAFTLDRGYGWRKAIRQNHRRRNVYPEAIRDTFLFTRDNASWECEVADGNWIVEICVGDAGHEQTGQKITIEGKAAVSNVATPAGGFFETTARVKVVDGRLTIELGPQAPGCNTCLNWVQIVPDDQE